MHKLDVLAQALRSGAQGKADLAGLDEQYTRATNLRDSRSANIDQYGQVSSLAAMADVLNNSRGRRDVRELEPQRTAARQSVAESANVMPLYKARTAAEAGTQKQTNFDTTAGLNRAKNAETVRSNKANFGLKQSQFDQSKKEAGSTVELVSTKDPQNSIMVGKLGQGYFDMNTGEPFDATGWTEKVKNTRSSGSRYTRSKSEDPYGNDVITIFDKSIGEEQVASFGDGTPYTLELAKKRGGQRAAQAGDETYAKEGAKVAQDAALAAGKETAQLYKSLVEMDKGIAAIKAGAETGFIANLLPNMREQTIKLQSAVDNLALADIGQYTFGSLSEAEAAWLRTANMPMTLDEDVLLPWLQKRADAVKRAIEVSKYVTDMRRARFEPDQKVIDQIMRRGGFTYED